MVNDDVVEEAPEKTSIERRASAAARVLRELCDRGPETRTVFHRDYVAPVFPVSIEDVDVLHRVVRYLVAALVEPTPDAWTRLRSAAAVLDGQALRSPQVAVVAAPPVGPSSETSPWAGGQRRPPPPTRPIEPLDALGQTAASTPSGPSKPALPFPETPKPPSGPQPKLTLQLYASYRAARDASAEQAARFLEQHGVADAAAEDAAWGKRISADAALARQFEQLKQSYDAWWRKP